MSYIEGPRSRNVGALTHIRAKLKELMLFMTLVEYCEETHFSHSAKSLELLSHSIRNSFIRFPLLAILELLGYPGT